MRGGLIAAVLAIAVTALAAPAAQAQPPVGEFRADDAGAFRGILPPGTHGTTNAVELGLFLTAGEKPEHNADQLPLYDGLVQAVPGIDEPTFERLFKDESFGVAPGDAARTYSPRDDVTIVRDASFGVPHVYGATRAGAMFGLGYVAAEDRLFFIDVLRNAGRAQLSSFAGGAEGNRAVDADQWEVAPYTEADLQRQAGQLEDLYGAEGAVVRSDLEHYVAGINQYIAEARIDPSKLPGEYFAINRPQGPEEWKITDIIATASLVGGILGKGGGHEVRNLELRRAFVERFGERDGERLWREWSAFEDPAAPTTLEDEIFRYNTPPKRGEPRAVAAPDPGSVERVRVRPRPQDEGGAPRGAREGLFGPGRLLPPGAAASNALLIHRTQSETGRPLAVFGPQTGYFSPQILMEQDVHAPASAAGPGIDARGAAFPGVSLYVQLGRGQDYAWSATSAGQDIIDTFALKLCEPDGSAPTKDSMHYRFRGRCLPIEVLTRTNSWSPNLADMTPSGSETLTAQRTQLGLVRARGLQDGAPVAYAELRSTYFHEVDSALGFKDFNDPAAMENAREFQRAAHKIGYTFNWFYVDDRDIAYYNSGWNPERADDVNGVLPVPAEKEWKGFDPVTDLSDRTPFAEHPQAINGQRVMSSWNNKQARGYRAGTVSSFTSVHRSDMLDQEIRVRIKGERRMSLRELVDAMGEAGTTDLRGEKVLYWALRLIGTPRDPELREAVEKLRAWQRDGAHRRDLDEDGTYEHSEAIRIMDAWWPLWMRAQFEPTLGKELFAQMREALAFDNEPNNGGAHLGSAYQSGWYGYAYKDIRTILDRDVEGPYARRYCGRGQRAACRDILLGSLKDALDVPVEELYADEQCADAGVPNDQRCFDAIFFRPIGGVTQPFIDWQNRPTYQQAVEVRGHRPR